ncbi:MAG TPA: hypothetical protein VMT62_05625 [Syntrophorhabdaceae bacterium]|nr:hypothetical protein [Syntrophorhabdaceae bacterium]
MDIPGETKRDDEDRTTLKAWFFVIGLAVIFLLYGLFMFFTIGDKGPPDWDFTDVEDTPGKSLYSTSPQPAGNTGEPHLQHVSEKPIPPQQKAGRRAE